MAEKTAFLQVKYVSDNPEQDWEQFEETMKRILTASKNHAEADDSGSSAKNLSVNKYESTENYVQTGSY